MPTQAELGRLLEEYQSVTNRLEALNTEMKQLSGQLKHLAYSLQSASGDCTFEVKKNYISLTDYHHSIGSCTLKDTVWEDAVRLLTERKEAQAKKNALGVRLEPYIGKQK